MFDLQQSVTDWRRQMLAAGIETVRLEELESHLHEDFERLVKSGLDERNAFNIAVQNIGPVQALRDEFEKVQATQQGRNWRVFEIVLSAAALLNPFLVGGLAFLLKNGRFSGMTSSQQISSLAAAATFSLLAWGMRWNCGRFPIILTSRIRDVIFLPALLWLVAFAYVIMPRCDFPMSQRGVVSLWGFAPFGILVGWLWGMVAAQRKKVATTVS